MTMPEYVDVPRDAAVAAFKMASELLRLGAQAEIPNPNPAVREGVKAALNMWADNMAEHAIKHELDGLLRGLDF